MSKDSGNRSITKERFITALQTARHLAADNSDLVAFIDEKLDLLDDFTPESIGHSKINESLGREFEFAKDGYLDTNNPYFLFEAFTLLVNNGIAPPNWVLKPLAATFTRQLANPDPALLPNHLNATGRVDEYFLYKSRQKCMLDIFNLLRAYDIKRIDAARAVVIKYYLSLDPKSLLNDFTGKFEKPFAGFSYSECSIGPDDRIAFLRSFPVAARKYLKKPRI